MSFSAILADFTMPLDRRFVDRALHDRIQEFRLAGTETELSLRHRERSLAHIAVAEEAGSLALEPYWCPASSTYYYLRHMHWCGALYAAITDVAKENGYSMLSVPTFKSMPIDMAGVKPNVLRSLERAHRLSAFPGVARAADNRILVELR